MSQTGHSTKPILFVLSIDTEEEWDWSGPFPQKHGDVNNIQHIPEFHQTISRLGVKPTYFVDYAVLENRDSIQTMQQVMQQQNSEIGAHLHPWCNPPYFEHVGEAESHVVNLPVEQVEQKLRALVEKIQDSLAVTPKSFRSGRWGIDGKVMQLLHKYGFNVDSSVYPLYKNEYFSCLGAPSTPYWADITQPLQASREQIMHEIPVTVGFNRSNFEFWNAIHDRFATPQLSWTRFNGIAWHTNLLRKNYLCPELTSVAGMQQLCDMAIKKGYPLLHMYMHSSSLLNNNNSLLGKDNAFNHICRSIQQVVSYLEQRYDIEFCTISDASLKLQA